MRSIGPSTAPEASRQRDRWPGELPVGPVLLDSGQGRRREIARLTLQNPPDELRCINAFHGILASRSDSSEGQLQQTQEVALEDLRTSERCGKLRREPRGGKPGILALKERVKLANGFVHPRRRLPLQQFCRDARPDRYKDLTRG